MNSRQLEQLKAEAEFFQDPVKLQFLAAEEKKVLQKQFNDLPKAKRARIEFLLKHRGRLKAKSLDTSKLDAEIEEIFGKVAGPVSNPSPAPIRHQTPGNTPSKAVVEAKKPLTLDDYQKVVNRLQLVKKGGNK